MTSAKSALKDFITGFARVGHHVACLADGIVDTGAKKICYFDPATAGNLLIELIEEKD